MEFHRHSQYILEQFNQQREMGLLCDCTFMVDGVVFKAHKAVLAACSQYFRMLFVEHKEVVDLDISSSEGLGIVLEFMYTGRLNLTSETVDSVLAVAGFLQMQAVTVSCRVFKSPQKTGADSVHIGAQNTNRIKSQAKKTNAPMRTGKVWTWEVQPLSAGETPESVGTGTGTGPAGRLTLRLKQEGGQSTEEPAGMEVELEDSESEETEDEESEIQVEIKDEDEEAIVYVDDVSDVDYTPGNSVNDAVSKSYGVRWQGGTKSRRRDSPAGDDGNQTNRKGFVESCPEPSSEGDLQLQIKVENEITAVDCGQQWLNEAQQAKSTENTTEEKNAPKEEKGFAVMSDEDVRDLLEQEENKNTAMKTRVDINRLQDYMQSRLLEHRPLHTIPPSQLNDILATFFLDVRKKDGSEYEPTTLRGILSSAERHLQKSGYQCSILTDVQFKKARDHIKAKQKHLRKLGLGSKARAAEEITEEIIEELYRQGQLGTRSPYALQNMLWLTTMLSFRMKAGQEQKNLKWGDVTIERDTNGQEYLEYNRQEGTHVGDARTVKLRAYATDNPDRDPVTAYKLFREKRPQAMLTDDSPFYLSINKRFCSIKAPWYKPLPLGVNNLRTILQTMVKKANVARNRRFTNISVRKLVLQKLKSR